MKISEQKVELIDYMGSDLSVVNAARVSFNKESEWEYPNYSLLTPFGLAQIKREGTFNNDYEKGERKLSDKDQKLINYLARHNHWTPFAHCFLSFRIKTPIFVARQLVKHQVGLAWNEVSRRYVDDEPEFWFPRVWRGKPVNAKQGSDGVVEGFNDEDDVYHDFSEKSRYITERALDTYNLFIEGGMAPEQARMVLPLNTMTEWIWSGSLMAFARVCKLRLDPHAQAETSEVAEKINDLVPDQFHHAWSALLA
jgi:thymidylate synthase (FAD)